MNSPPAIASPARSTAARMPSADENTAAGACGAARARRRMSTNAEIEREHAEQHRAGKRRVEHDAAARDQRRERRADADRDREQREIGGDGRPRRRRCSVLISGGSSDSTTMPTSQNQLVTSAPHHSRASARKCGSSPRSRRRCWRRLASCGAPCAGRRDQQRRQPAGEREADHQQRERWRCAAAARRAAGDGAGQDGDEGRAFDQRVAGRQLFARADGRAECHISSARTARRSRRSRPAPTNRIGIDARE